MILRVGLDFRKRVNETEGEESIASSSILVTYRLKNFHLNNTIENHSQLRIMEQMNMCLLFDYPSPLYN